MKAPPPASAVFCFFLGILLLFSCDILRDSPFAVVSWSPGSEYAPLGEDRSHSIALTFSGEADRCGVEKEFTITEDGAELRGSFVWADSRTVRFEPYAPLRENREYRLTLGAEAASSSGVSMDDAFDKRFFTRLSGERPRTLSVFPSNGSIVEDPRAAILIVFSTPVEAASCRDYVSISPAVSGSWSIDQAGTTACFIGAELWETGKEYLVEVSADMIDQKRIRLGDAHRFRFQVGSDRTAPILNGAYALDSLGAQTAALAPDDPNDAVFRETSSWETFWRLRLDFSEEVEFAEVDSRLACENGPPLIRETPGLRGSAATYRLSERPAWDSRFAFRLSSGFSDGRGNAGKAESLFRVHANGKASRPPRLIGIRLPLAPGGVDETAQELSAYSVGSPFASLAISAGADRYPLSVATAARIELYFETADGAFLDRYSLMESFRVEATNGALSFSPRNVKTSGFRYAEPHAPWTSYARAEVEGYLTNQASSGVVSISVDAGCIDSLRNESAEAVVLPLLK